MNEGILQAVLGQTRIAEKCHGDREQFPPVLLVDPAQGVPAAEAKLLEQNPIFQYEHRYAADFY
jgi:hypothetical protein